MLSSLGHLRLARPCTRVAPRRMKGAVGAQVQTKGATAYV